MEYNTLQHHGVKGMRWGVRRKRSTVNSSENDSDDAKTVAEIKKKKVSEMSNAELRKVNDRITLEQNYQRMHPSKVKRGLTAAAGVAAALGTVASLYENGKKVVKYGKEVYNAIPKK